MVNMKKILFIFMACAGAYLCSYSQSAENKAVGINTETTGNGIILQVDRTGSGPGGVLFPRVKLSANNVFAPVTGTSSAANGLIVYNTATNGTGMTAVTPGYYFWNSGKNLWVKMSTKGKRDIAVYSNQDTSIDVNANKAGVFIDLFANLRYNTNPGLFQKISDYGMRINEIGFYKIAITLDVAENGGADNFGCEIMTWMTEDIYNITASDKMFIPGRWDDENGKERNFPIGKNFVICMPVNTAGTIITIRSYEIDPSTQVYMKNADTSTISIEKIR
jgi:hypothetical protein